jgi:hypothetical protein
MVTALARGGTAGMNSGGTSNGVGGMATALVHAGSLTVKQISANSGQMGGAAGVSASGSVVTLDDPDTGSLMFSGAGAVMVVDSGFSGGIVGGGSLAIGNGFSNTSVMLPAGSGGSVV